MGSSTTAGLPATATRSRSRSRPASDYLHRQVDLIEPRVICTLGNFATKLPPGDTTGISRLHGQEEIRVIGPRAVRLYPIYHPAAALYTPSTLETLRADFQRIPEVLALPVPDQPEPVEEVPEYEDEPEPVAAGPGPQADQLGLLVLLELFQSPQHCGDAHPGRGRRAGGSLGRSACPCAGGMHGRRGRRGGVALSKLQAGAPDAVVLDCRFMPDLDGMEVCRRLRAAEDRTPVLLLTARDGVGDRVAGLDAGADDYLPKPFALEELLARLRALLRRTALNGDAPAGPLRFGDLTLDLGAHRARMGDRDIDLTRTQSRCRAA